jgi:ferritin-like metal-binding protein YciE
MAKQTTDDPFKDFLRDTLPALRQFPLKLQVDFSELVDELIDRQIDEPIKEIDEQIEELKIEREKLLRRRKKKNDIDGKPRN